MAQTTGIEADVPLVPTDKADDAGHRRTPYDRALATDPDLVVYRITGAFFFGAASTIGSVLDGIADSHKALLIDVGAVPFLDSSAANTISRIARKARKRGVAVFVTSSYHTVRRTLLTHGVRPPFARYRETIARAIADIESDRKKSPVGTDSPLPTNG